MSTAGWSRLEDLFHRAAALPPPERAALLDTECAGDAALRAEVESLLGHDAPPGEEIAHAIRVEAEAIEVRNNQALIGQRIGAYRVTGIIGQGGMGAVYRAVRDDDQYRKEVAIKLVRQGFETNDLLERFRAERQILASLEHPYVARLLDGGTTSGGLPYLVMELVEGMPIGRYANDRSLSIEDRLRLFQKVCEAVQYAHANLTVHRDLKPANILITSSGTPKLLDFGIAKLLTPDGRQPNEEAKGTVRMLTPAYASPEQVRGAPVTTATDIYSLGAILYELLTGHSPHQIAGSTPAEIERAICTTEPRLPSQAAGLEVATPRRLAGDLDNIVLKALRKEPERRYRSVEQFSDDIGRHLSGLPVTARADTLSYRSGKFIRRNRVAIVAGAAVVIALAGGLAVSLIQARRAERRFDQVRRLAHTVLFEIHDGVVNLPGSTAVRQTIVRTALEYLSSLSADARNDPSLEAELAEAYIRVGDVQGDPLGASLDDAKGALASYGHAVDLYTAAASSRPKDPGLQTAFGFALLKLGERQFASGDAAAARHSYSEAQRIFEAILARSPSDRRALKGFGGSCEALGELLSNLGDLTGAVPQASKGVEIARRMLDAEPANPELRETLASSLGQLGNVLIDTRELEKAVDSFREALRLREQLVLEDPQNTAKRHDLMISESHLGQVLGTPTWPNIGDFAGARVHFQRMLEIAESLASLDPANKNAQFDLAQTHVRMGALLAASDPPAAIGHLRSALDIYARLIAADTQTIEFAIGQAFAETELGNLLASQGRLKEGIGDLRNAMTISRSILAREPMSRPGLIQVLIEAEDLALALARSGDRTSLDALTAQTLPFLEQLHHPAESARRPRTLYAFGQAYSLLRARREACGWFGKSVDAWHEIESSAGVNPIYRSRQADAIRENAGCVAESKTSK